MELKLYEKMFIYFRDTKRHREKMLLELLLVRKENRYQAQADKTEGIDILSVSIFREMRLKALFHGSQ